MDRNGPILHSLLADDTICVRWCSIWLTSRRLMLRELFSLLLVQKQSLQGPHSELILRELANARRGLYYRAIQIIFEVCQTYKVCTDSSS